MVNSKAIKVSDRLPTFAGVYKVKLKSGEITMAFFKHYGYEHTWKQWIELWFEENDTD